MSTDEIFVADYVFHAENIGDVVFGNIKGLFLHVGQTVYIFLFSFVFVIIGWVHSNCSLFYLCIYR